MARTRLIVAAAAAAAAAFTVALVALTSEPPPEPTDAEPPPLFLAAPTLRRAVSLYEQGKLDEARIAFERQDSVEAKVGAAFARWPHGTVEQLRTLPDRGVVRLHLGVALAALDREAEARAELRRVERLTPDSFYAIRAEDFLHPEFAPGLPFFVPSRPPTGALRDGIRLQRLGRPISARRAFDAAVRSSPNDPEALAAAAVARFDKDRPALAFGRLGPLSRRFPRAQTVRFHLGMLLLWMAEVPEARRQLERARALDPDSRLGREAKRFLDRLPNDGTS